MRPYYLHVKCAAVGKHLNDFLRLNVCVNVSLFSYYSSVVYTKTDAFPSCCPVLWDLLNNSGVSDGTSCQRTIWTAVSTTHLKTPVYRQRPDLTDPILKKNDLRYTYDTRTLI